MLLSMRTLALRSLLALLAGAAIALLAAVGLARGQDQAQAGLLDLRQWQPAEGIVALDGHWQFVPGRLVGPQEPWPADAGMLQVPGSWNSAQGGGHGVGTYRLQLLCASQAPMTFALPVQNSAFRLFVDGQELAAQGRPGTAGGGHAPAIVRQLALLPRPSCPAEIRIHVSNFEWYRGGLVRSIQVGEPTQMAQRREEGLTRALLAGGATLMVALFSLSFFFAYSLRRGDRTPLYFGLFCLSVVASLGLAAERVFQPYVGWMGFEGQIRLLFANWSLGLAAFPLFLGSLYAREAGKWPLRVITAFSAMAIVASLLLPVQVFTRALTPALQFAAVATALYVAGVLVRALLNGRFAAGVLLAGLAVLVAAVAHDIAFFQHLLSSSMLPYGMLGFVIAPAVLLALRLAKALGAEELRLLEQRGRTDLLLRATNAGVLDWNATTGEVKLSDRYREMLGYPAGPGAADPPPFRSLLHPDDHDKVHGSFVAQLRDRSVRGGIRVGESMDYRMLRADGQVIWVHAAAIAVCGADGRTLRYICTFIDISAIKATEQALETERERLRLLVRSTKAGFGDWDAARDVVTYSARFKEMLGYPADHDTSSWPSIFEMMHPDDRERARTQFRGMIRRREPGTQMRGEPMSYRLQRRDGSYVWIHAEGISLVDDTGRTERFITSYLDVTHFHEQEEALRAQVELTRTEQRRLDLVVRAARVGIVDWDGQTHATYYSPRFREIRGYPPDADTSGWPDYFKVMIHPDDRGRITKRWVAFIRGQGPEGPQGEYYSPEEYRLLQADGGYVWVQVSGIAVRDERGFVLRWIAAIIDITERRAQEQALLASRDQVAAQAAQLERQNEALKENVRLREEVERIGRHDLKTPLNSIVAVPRLLREERKLGPEADELLGIVERAGYRILSMVNLSLDLYKMEQGSYIFRPDAVDLAELVQKVLSDLRVHAQSKQVRLELQAEGAPYAWAEELLCYSLVANLLKNAVEASPEGVAVRVRIEPAEDGGVLLHIHNHGVVPQAIRASFFQKYATLGKASGTGLGTYSARLMARVQDGDVRMQTSEQDGTTLTVQLRAAPAGKVPATVRHAAERREMDQRALADLPPTRVLLVDDDEYNLLIVRRFLPSPPFEVSTAINGRVAVAAAQAQWPNLIFMDLDMPVMGGMEAVRRLRAMEAADGKARCTMVALSSHEDEQTQQAALAAGFDRYLVKPVTRDSIRDTLLALQGHGAAALRPAPDEHASAAPSSGVVHVDQDMEPVLGDFMASRRALIAQLDGAIGRDDRAELRRLAHQLAGSFALYGFGWASERSRWLEKNAPAVQAAEVHALAGELRHHLDTVEIRFVAQDA